MIPAPHLHIQAPRGEGAEPLPTYALSKVQAPVLTLRKPMKSDVERSEI